MARYCNRLLPIDGLRPVPHDGDGDLTLDYPSAYLILNPIALLIRYLCRD